MMSDKLKKAINEQINAELYSSYLYFSMASWFEAENYPGMASWMKLQAQEEMGHAMKLYDFVNDRRHKVDLLPVKGPKTFWNSPLEVFKDAFEHEKYVTSRFNDLMSLAREEKDYACEAFFQWFITEQIEEEATADSIVAKMELMKDAKNALYLLDKELGGRSSGAPEENA